LEMFVMLLPSSDFRPSLREEIALIHIQTKSRQTSAEPPGDVHPVGRHRVHLPHRVHITS